MTKTYKAEFIARRAGADTESMTPRTAPSLPHQILTFFHIPCSLSSLRLAQSNKSTAKPAIKA